MKKHSIKFPKDLIRNLLRKVGVGVTTYSNLENITSLIENEVIRHDLEFIREMQNLEYETALNLLSKSKAQLRQDIFVLCEMQFNKEDFFVEFGAANGVEYSNSYLLEMEYNWSGILCEPAKVWHKDLMENRPNSILDFSCVWSESGHQLKFYETEIHELSTLQNYTDRDLHENNRNQKQVYNVITISLNDLLRKHNAPREMGYLSIDTEGSEYDILKTFDFDTYSFKVITVEHNFGVQRSKIHALLKKHGYSRKFIELSKFDDWYVKD